MKDTLTETAPERVWLQVDIGASNDYRDVPFPADIDGVPWHDEELGGLEVGYVRADVADWWKARAQELEVALGDLLQEILRISAKQHKRPNT